MIDLEDGYESKREEGETTLTDYERHQLMIIYEEAKSRGHNSMGAWHVKLVEFIINLGYNIQNYRQALNTAELLLFGGC